MVKIIEISESIACPACGAPVSPRLLACPSCRGLIHAERLNRLAASANTAAGQGDTGAQLAAWREALELLPPTTRQHQIISQKIVDLDKRLESDPKRPTSKPGAKSSAAGGGSTKGWKGAAGLGGISLILWKFKFVAILLAGKLKFLLLGLTKASTFFSMFLSIGVYWTAFGAPLAIGLVISIYIHEMGHVATLTRYGHSASAPLFIPGLGALIRLRRDIPDPRQDARIGLAGPVWGLGAAIVAAVVYYATAKPIWGAIAQLGAWINLFNLIPIWSLDGGRAFRTLPRRRRRLAVLAIGVVWLFISSVDPGSKAEGMLVLIGAGAIFRSVAGEAPHEPDDAALATYIALVAALAALASLPVAL